jgi:hypothetical protein
MATWVESGIFDTVHEPFTVRCPAPVTAFVTLTSFPAVKPELDPTVTVRTLEASDQAVIRCERFVPSNGDVLEV